MLAVEDTPRTDPVAPLEPRRSSSARAVLQVLALLARSPDGLRADEAAEALGRSVSTAYSLLDSLCQEGFAVHEHRGAYRIAPGTAGAHGQRTESSIESLIAVLDELYVRTNKRAYLVAARGGALVVPATRGRQGMRRMPGLRGRIGDEAHALALGKVALSLRGPEELAAYIQGGLKRFTPHTITRPDRLFAELEDVRAEGIAHDREESAEDFCCLAAPVRSAGGRAIGIVGISMSRRSYDAERDALAATVRDVAGRARIPVATGSRAALSENGGRS